MKKSGKIYPSAVFNTDMKYFAFLDNLLEQTNMLSVNNRASLYIGANEMYKKKLLHDFLCETKRRLTESV